MTKLNRRAFLLSAGVAVVAAPLLAKAEPYDPAVLYQEWENLVKFFDGATPEQQQRMLAKCPLAREMNEMSDEVKRTIDKMEAYLRARKKVLYE